MGKAAASTIFSQSSASQSSQSSTSSSTSIAIPNTVTINGPSTSTAIPNTVTINGPSTSTAIPNTVTINGPSTSTAIPTTVTVNAHSSNSGNSARIDSIFYPCEAIARVNDDTQGVLIQFTNFYVVPLNDFRLTSDDLKDAAKFSGLPVLQGVPPDAIDLRSDYSLREYQPKLVNVKKRGRFIYGCGYCDTTAGDGKLRLIKTHMQGNRTTPASCKQKGIIEKKPVIVGRYGDDGSWPLKLNFSSISK